MARIKPVMPTLREKKRYVAFEIISKQQIKNFSDVSKAVWNTALSFAGEFGMAYAGLNMISNTYDAQKQKGLLRVNNKHTDTAKTALALVTRIDEQPVIIRTLGISGILAKATKKYLT